MRLNWAKRTQYWQLPLFHFGEITIPELKDYLQKKILQSEGSIPIPGNIIPGYCYW